MVALVFLSGCSGGDGDGLKKHPVRGSVRINGKPAPRVVVRFNNLDDKVAGNAALPVGMTDEQGRYELSTNADKDGAVEGEYAVTFFWPSDTGAMPTDLLERKFSDPASSKFRVKVGPNDNEVPSFEVEFKPKARKASAKPAPVQ